MEAKEKTPVTAGAKDRTYSDTTIIPHPNSLQGTFPLATAFNYTEIGLAVHPLCGPQHRECSGAGKIPWNFNKNTHLWKWQSHGIPTSDEIEVWLSYPTAKRANIGCLTGKVSGIVAVDVDGIGGERLLEQLSRGNVPATWEYRTGNGRRLMFAYDGRVKTVRDLQGNHEGLEILSDGAQVVLPPSMHPSGRVYEWAPGRDPWSFGSPAPVPKWLLKPSAQPRGSTVHELQERRSQRIVELQEIAAGVTHGERNISAARLAGYLMRSIDAVIAEHLLRAWDATNNPPLGAELDTVIDSIARAELQRRGWSK